LTGRRVEQLRRARPSASAPSARRDAAVGRRLTDAERPLGCRGRRPRHRGILSFAAWRRAVRLSAAVMGGFAHLRLTADAAPGDADRRASGGTVVRRTGSNSRRGNRFLPV